MIWEEITSVTKVSKGRTISICVPEENTFFSEFWEHNTRLAKKIGEALDVSTAKYDASKSVWEDIIGFPDPAKLMNLETRGTVVGIPRIETPTSIWGKRFVLVDEINRAAPEIQSKWLEIILDQTLMGEPTGTKWIISAMNPGYAGTNPLDLALASRYMFFIQAPLGVKMTEEKLTDVLNLENPEEYPALMTWKNSSYKINKNNIDIEDKYTPVSDEASKKFNLAAEKLKLILSAAALNYSKVESYWGEQINEYTISVVKFLLREARFNTDVRRIRMIKNALIAMISIETVVKDTQVSSLTSTTIQELAFKVLTLSYPTVAGMDGPTYTQLENAHKNSQDLLEDKHSMSYQILMEQDPIKKLCLLFTYPERDSVLTYRVVEEVLNKNTEYTSYSTAFALLSAHKKGLSLDAQILNLILQKLSTALDVLSSMSTRNLSSATIEDIFKLNSILNKQTYSEVIAMKITFIAINKLSESPNVNKLCKLLEDYYSSIYADLNNKYTALVSIIPNSGTSITYSEDDWEELKS
jgi:hypothetical protein